MRDLVTQEQVLSAESIVLVTSQTIGGTVMEIRGFQSEGQMTYRLLIQQPNGQIDEVLVNGTNGRHVSPSSQMGQIVSAVARNTSVVLVTAKSAIAAPENGKTTN